MPRPHRRHLNRLVRLPFRRNHSRQGERSHSAQTNATASRYHSCELHRQLAGRGNLRELRYAAAHRPGDPELRRLQAKPTANLKRTVRSQRTEKAADAVPRPLRPHLVGDRLGHQSSPPLPSHPRPAYPDIMAHPLETSLIDWTDGLPPSRNRPRQSKLGSLAQRNEAVQVRSANIYATSTLVLHSSHTFTRQDVRP